MNASAPFHLIPFTNFGSRKSEYRSPLDWPVEGTSIPAEVKSSSASSMDQR